MEEKVSKRKRIIRTTAILLIVAMLVTTLASYLATGATIAEQTQIVDANTAAEDYLAKNTDYVQAGRLDRAKALLGQALSGFREDYNSHQQALSVAIANEKYDKALEEANACLELLEESDPNYLDILTKKGCIEALLGKYEDAKVSFEKVLELNPDMAQAHLLLAELCLESAEVVPATEHLVRYAELTPEDVSQLPVIAELYYGQNKYEKAIEYGEKAVESGAPEDMDLRNAIGLSKLLLGRYSDAIEDLNMGIELGEKEAQENPTKVYAIAPLNETYYYRGLCKLTLASYSEAIADYDQAINTGYETSLAYYNRAVCKLQQEDYQGCYDDMKVVQEKNDEEELVEIARTITDAIDQALAEAQAQADAAAASASQMEGMPGADGTLPVPGADGTIQVPGAADGTAPAVGETVPAPAGPEMPIPSDAPVEVPQGAPVV